MPASPIRSTTGRAGHGSATRSGPSTSAGRAGRCVRPAWSIVVSDGWDRGDPSIVATETARLRRNCHRLVWLNPLAGTPGYQPLAGGMRAAYPYIDDFLPAGTVASLERLGEILGGVRSADTRRGSEAAAHAARPGSAGKAGLADLTAVARPGVVGGTPVDRAAARPLR
ncbi:MAG: VWA domain-containing protein [Candidatus Limnocylindrales bacterium]